MRTAAVQRLAAILSPAGLVTDSLPAMRAELAEHCIARHTRSGVAGIGTSRTPKSRSASTTALITAGGAPVVPPSPPPLTPSGLLGASTSLFSHTNDGNISARGMA